MTKKHFIALAGLEEREEGKAMCAICGKPPSSYPNWLLSQGQGFHVGCLARAYQELHAAHGRLLDKLVASGFYGPWADDWEGSYEATHWGEDT